MRKTAKTTTTTTVKYSEKSDFIELSMRMRMRASVCVRYLLRNFIVGVINAARNGIGCDSGVVLLLLFALIERIFSHSQITH